MPRPQDGLGFESLCCLLLIPVVGMVALPVELRDLTVGPEIFAKNLKTNLIRMCFFSDGTHTYEFVLHFIGCSNNKTFVALQQLVIV